MDFRRDINDVCGEFADGILVTDPEGRVVMSEGRMTFPCGEKVRWLARGPRGDGEWEAHDAADDAWYLVRSKQLGDGCRVHAVKNISDYMALNRDMIDYVAFFREMSRFQSALMEKLNRTYYEVLSVLAKQFDCAMAYFLLTRDNGSEVVAYDARTGKYDFRQVPTHLPMPEGDDLPEPVREQLAPGGEAPDCALLCSGDAFGWAYCILTVGASVAEVNLVRIVQVYVENTILNEQLRFDSEHDKMTGLFNRAKFMSMSEVYRNMDAVCVLNLDVNDLKETNDTRGHKAGDALLAKAAESIRRISGPDVHGYRMGGDEFVVIGCHMNEIESEALVNRWREALKSLNEVDDGISCQMASGMACGAGDYDYDRLLAEADVRMYENKRAMKHGRNVR